MAERIPYAAPATARPLSVAGGVAGFGDIVSASFTQMQLVENTNASQVALEDAYAARTAAVKAATGIDLGHPLFPDLFSADPDASFGGVATNPGAIIEAERARYNDRLQELAAQFPQHSAVIKASTPLARDAEALARQADEELGRLLESRPGWDGMAAAFAGGAGGSLRDPLTIGSLLLGGGPGAARTVAGRIATVAFKEALLNGATEAAAQPIVQDWRRQAGLPHGFDEAVRNVLFATTLGGVIGGAGRGAYEAIGGIARRSGKLNDRATAALDGDPAAAADMLAGIRDVLPAEARGALDAIEIERAVAPQAGEAARRAEILQTRAMLHAQNPALARETLEPLPIDEDQVARIVKGFEAELTGAEGSRGGGATAPEATSRPVTGFVKSIGGIKPGSPLAIELEARGITSRSVPGLFRREGRAALDNIPFDELPSELRGAMRPEGDTVYARQQEFIDGLEAELRPDQKAILGLDDEAEAMLADVDARARRVLLARPGSDDAFVREAVTMMADEGLDLDAAIGRVESRIAGTRSTLPDAPERPTMPPDLAELEARLAADEGDDGIDFKALKEAGFGSDAVVPWGDGTISIEALQKELDELSAIERAVSVCQL